MLTILLYYVKPKLNLYWYFLNYNRLWPVLVYLQKLLSVSSCMCTHVLKYYDLNLLYCLLMWLMTLPCHLNLLPHFVFWAYRLQILGQYLGFVRMCLNLYGLLGLDYGIWVYVVILKRLLKLYQFIRFRL